MKPFGKIEFIYTQTVKGEQSLWIAKDYITGEPERKRGQLRGAEERESIQQLKKFAY